MRRNDRKVDDLRRDEDAPVAHERRRIRLCCASARATISEMYALGMYLGYALFGVGDALALEEGH